MQGPIYAYLHHPNLPKSFESSVHANSLLLSFFYVSAPIPTAFVKYRMANTEEIRAQSYVGFDSITQQIEHKLLKRGFQFNVIVVGEYIHTILFCETSQSSSVAGQKSFIQCMDELWMVGGPASLSYANARVATRVLVTFS